VKIVVLRWGHRYVRDDRATTHLFLVARAFGADKVLYTGQRDQQIEAKIKEVARVWGGVFDVEYKEEGVRVLKAWQRGGGHIVHLSMYGLPLQHVIEDIRRSPADKLIVVGGAKVPKYVYEVAAWNVAVTSQPHSEIGSLSVFLHEFFEGRELVQSFENAELVIVPQAKGKKIVKRLVT